MFVVNGGVFDFDDDVMMCFISLVNLGKFLDPLVDKLLVLAPLLALVELDELPAWGVFLILARELAIAGWRVNQTKIQGANLWGKLKTVSQIGAIALLIAPLPEVWRTPSLIAFWISVALTWISGLIYLWPQKNEQPSGVEPTQATDS